MKASIAAIGLLSTLLASCGAPEPAPTPQREDWMLSTHVVFRGADGKTQRPLPRQPLRLWMPFVVGDIYGAPNAGELVPVTLKPDMSFSVDLNDTLAPLAKALIPTAFSQDWMAIEPASARIARLSPFVLPEDGIAPLGTSEWLDEDTGARLMLIYVDRPSRVLGEIVYEGRKLRFDIEAKEAGYLWIHQPDGNGTYRATPRPARLVLAVMPN